MFSSIRSRSASVRVRRSLVVVAGFAAAALIVSACSTNNVLSLRPDVDLGVETAAVSVRPVSGMQALVPDDPYMSSDPNPDDPSLNPNDPSQAGYTTPNDPYADPGFNDPNGDPYSEPYVEGPAPMPADEVACREQLERLDVAYQELDPIEDGGACQIAHPIKVSAIGRVKMQPAATLRCEMAVAVATWTKKELIPSARSRYLTGVKTIHQASSYSCRNIRRTRTASEHSKGNALDVRRIELNNGRDIEVEKPGLFAFRTRGLLNNVRADACDYFSTVLGPGYDRDHKDHFHFDIKPRRNGRVACH